MFEKSASSGASGVDRAIRLALALAALIFSASTQATVIHIIASGSFIAGYDANFPQPGTAWSIDWTIDSAAINGQSDPDAPGSTYFGLTGTTTIGTTAVPSGDGSGSVFIIHPDPLDPKYSGLDVDGVEFRLSTDFGNLPAIDGVVVHGFFLPLWTRRFDLFTDESLASILALPSGTFHPSDFRPPTFLFFTLFDPAYYPSPSGPRTYGLYERAGQIDSLSVSVVPVPAAGWLLATALGVLGVRRRREAA